jgi:hypothetical protein
MFRSNNVQNYFEFGIPKVHLPKEMVDGVRITELPCSIPYQFGELVGMKLGPVWLRKRLAGRMILCVRGDRAGGTCGWAIEVKEDAGARSAPFNANPDPNINRRRL